MNGYEVAHEIIKEVNKVIIGKEEVVKKVLTCFLAGGHILIDDIPGVGKTTMAIAFAKAMNLEQNRIQFTSDVMPSDVFGFTIFDQAENEFKYKPKNPYIMLFMDLLTLKQDMEAYYIAEGADRTVKDVYLNAEYKGSNASVYAGAYAGSGEGTPANLFHPEGGE